MQTPTDATLAAAREAWLAARVPYQQTEVFRFGNPIVDEWEGRVNAWPLDEGLIDYVAVATYGDSSDENAFYAANVIANPKLTIGGKTIDASTIDAALLGSLHEIDEVEANVSRGYHAIEFLLWGQDLNGTGPGKGQRPASDYASGDACTGGNCDRRGAYLGAATDLLVSDLQEMVGNWGDSGAARAALAADGDQKGLAMMLTGLGSLSYGELAGERIKLGLMLHDPEEEHDCFSDNTHNSHFYDVVGMRAVYLGRYDGVDGKVTSGPSLSDLVRAADPAVDDEMRASLDKTLAAFTAIKQSADSGQMAYDQMLAEGNEAGQRHDPGRRRRAGGADAQHRARGRGAGCGPARVRGVRQPRQSRGGLPVSALVAMLARLARAFARHGVPRELRQARNTALLAQLAGGEGRNRHG